MRCDQFGLLCNGLTCGLGLISMICDSLFKEMYGLLMSKIIKILLLLVTTLNKILALLNRMIQYGINGFMYTPHIVNYNGLIMENVSGEPLRGFHPMSLF